MTEKPSASLCQIIFEPVEGSKMYELLERLRSPCLGTLLHLPVKFPKCLHFC